jgi:hypothetical protein
MARITHTVVSDNHFFMTRSYSDITSRAKDHVDFIALEVRPVIPFAIGERAGQEAWAMCRENAIDPTNINNTGTNTGWRHRHPKRPLDGTQRRSCKVDRAGGQSSWTNCPGQEAL